MCLLKQIEHLIRGPFLLQSPEEENKKNLTGAKNAMYIVSTLECTSQIFKILSNVLKIFQTLHGEHNPPPSPSMIKSFTVLRHFRDCMAQIQQQPH